METLNRVYTGEDSGMYSVGLGSLPEVVILKQPTKQQIALEHVTKLKNIFLNSLTKNWNEYESLVNLQRLLKKGYE